MRRGVARDFQERDKSKHESSSVNPLAGKILAGKASIDPASSERNLLSLFPRLLFKIFAIEHIPFTASWRYVTRRERIFGGLCRQYDLLSEKII
jgi:hypothetical protein